MSGKVYPLADAQRDAVDPTESVWLSASAGTGKTQVLSARVLRLLLQEGVSPSSILCLTFTKAGAAEMAVRVNRVLARWVRMNDGDLGAELAWLGAKPTPAMRNRARSLFASVLDCPGGGLRIDTIHAFAQYLLTAFPVEAGVVPGSRPIEDRERELLSRAVLSEMLGEGDERFNAAVAELSKRKGPDAVRGWLMQCAQALDLWTGPAGWQPPMRARMLRTLGLPSDADEQWLAEQCSDANFPVAVLRDMLPALQGWNAKGGRESSAFIEYWLSLDPVARFAELNGFTEPNRPLKKDGQPRAMGGAEKLDPAFADRQQALAHAIRGIRERKVALDLADFVVPQLEAGRAFALRWEEAKRREGVVDFDDLIAKAAGLLSDRGVADWIRYKLDRSFDHILVDEAQDTNVAQWDIIKALTDDYFDGLGAAGDDLRTVFAVGDYKQAIFGFQGTSPDNFREARDHFRARIRTNAPPAGSSNDWPTYALREYALRQSYRTASTILSFVDEAIAELGTEAIGIEGAEPLHIGEDRPGRVVLWNTVRGRGQDEDDGESVEGQDWLSRHDRNLADKIALQIRRWMDEGYPLFKGGQRRAGPGDVMVLVQKRRELAALIVARLHNHGVPVAGVDRLRIGNPLAVKDLMAALRFAAQPLDDLTLANLLVSPLIGWSQDDLLQYGYREGGRRLWEHLGRLDDDLPKRTVAALKDLLGRADFDTPQQLLRWILIGPMDGRRRLVARLGVEANDPIDELLNAAQAFTATQTASLHGFIRWFDAGDGELKRETSEAADQVRVMTVHGAKGLQAPIVILADATIGPGAGIDIALRENPEDEKSPCVPLPPLSKVEKPEGVQELEVAAKARALAEHWRLLYVAMTRAEEALFIGGSLNTMDARRGGPDPDSWYARLEPLFDEEALVDPIWGGIRTRGDEFDTVVSTFDTPQREPSVELPDWLEKPVAAEPRPPRPLAPSTLGEFDGAEPPHIAENLALAARRGVLMHALFERLPAVPPAERRAKATAWLKHQASDFDDESVTDIVDSTLDVLNDPAFAHVFLDEALAEVPLTALVNERVVTGVVDRLLIAEDEVTVIDFKTTKRPPQTVDDIPPAVLSQMSAYAAALSVIYPGRRVRAGVIYTQTPQLFELPPELLMDHEGLLGAAKESVAASGFEQRG